jgi:hypothetical protein
MKKIFLKLMIVPLLLIVAVGFASCGDKEPEEKYPLEVPFTEYSLEGTSCAWKTLEYGSELNPSEIAVINSNEELQNYLVCTEGSFPEIDFSKHTLILAHGGDAYLVKPNYKDLHQLSANRYEMRVNLLTTFLAMVSYWRVPIIVRKISNEATVELIITEEY